MKRLIIYFLPPSLWEMLFLAERWKLMMESKFYLPKMSLLGLWGFFWLQISHDWLLWHWRISPLKGWKSHQKCRSVVGEWCCTRWTLLYSLFAPWSKSVMCLWQNWIGSSTVKFLWRDWTNAERCLKKLSKWSWVFVWKSVAEENRLNMSNTL